MKRIEAIIRTSKFDEVKDALHAVGIEFFSYWDVTGAGNEIKKGDKPHLYAARQAKLEQYERDLALVNKLLND